MSTLRTALPLAYSCLHASCGGYTCIRQTTSHIYAVSHVEPPKRGQGIYSGYIGGESFRHTRWSRKSSGSLRAF